MTVITPITSDATVARDVDLLTRAGEVAEQLINILRRDLDGADGRVGLLLIDDYIHGRHRGPYLPPQADAEYRLLADRSTTNWGPLLIGTPAQAMYVDGHRPGGADVTFFRGGSTETPQWDFWQRSRLDARQGSVYRGSIGYGHSFVAVERNSEGKAIARLLSPLRTAATYIDPVNDEDPYAAITLERPATPKRRALWRLWFGVNEYEVEEGASGDGSDVELRVRLIGRHGAAAPPVVRFAPHVDLEGRTLGVIEPAITLQDRINQSIFDLLITQTSSSFKVRWVAGMAPPVKIDPETGDPVLDENGQYIPLPVNLNQKKMLFADDPDSKFGTLDETPLNGYIDSIDMSIRHLSALAQIPPHHLLGQIANLSAEALNAAETSLSRKVEEFRKSFGESWERVFRLAAEVEGDAKGAADYHAEVLWRDMEATAFSQTADGLSKLKDLGVPARGLWARVPGVTQEELREWDILFEEDSDTEAVIRALRGVMPGAEDDAEPVPEAA
ncbi:SPP1 Gp6-like portal protein [Salana multivorans]|uniref:SPP1 Gp6-like portal protein n=1 Tax=Salana multivorans TaxID=120377 RepID=A0A3N2D774_9MICO|nr:phage portal protein [Salana multivorans]ROR95508.1 SPP1 Gp6-like portal protein [Salana multivorans]